MCPGEVRIFHICVHSYKKSIEFSVYSQTLTDKYHFFRGVENQFIYCILPLLYSIT